MSYIACKLCGNFERSELNIEGNIHHSRPVVCYDKHSCKKRAKKKRDRDRKRKMLRKVRGWS